MFELQEALRALPDGAAFLLPDGSAWKFDLTEVTDPYGNRYTQAVAADVTELYRASQELAGNNAKLEEMAEHIRHVTDNVVAIAREEEILAMKMRVHNEVGARVLSTRRCYLGGCRPEEKAELVSHWRRTIDLLRDGIGRSDETDAYGELMEVAAAVGVEIVRTGALPEDPAAAYLLVAAIRECLTNAIRHASGDRLFVTVAQDGGRVSAVITNNGRPPEREITEGGGLSSLRARIGRAGGELLVQSLPQFSLTVTLPLKGDRLP